MVDIIIIITSNIHVFQVVWNTSVLFYPVCNSTDSEKFLHKLNNNSDYISLFSVFCFCAAMFGE